VTHVAKQQFLIAKYFLKLELIEESSIQTGFDESFVAHAFLVLLPAHIQEGRSAVVSLHPGIPAIHDSPD